MQPVSKDLTTDLNGVTRVANSPVGSTSTSNRPSITYATGLSPVSIESIEHQMMELELIKDSQLLQRLDLACAGFKKASEAEAHLKSFPICQRLGLRSLALDNQPLKGHLDLTSLVGLTHLYFQNTALEKVNISGLKHLQFVDVSGCNSLDLAFLAHLPDSCKIYLGGEWGMRTCADLKKNTDFFARIAEARVDAYSRGEGERVIDLTNFGLNRFPQKLRELFATQAAHSNVCVALRGNPEISGTELYRVFCEHAYASIDVEWLDLTMSYINFKSSSSVVPILKALGRMDIPLHITLKQYHTLTSTALELFVTQLPRIVVVDDQSEKRTVSFAGAEVHYIENENGGRRSRRWKRTDEESHLRPDEITVVSSVQSSGLTETATLSTSDINFSASTNSVPSYHPADENSENASSSRTTSETQTACSTAATVSSDKRQSAQHSLMQRQLIEQPRRSHQLPSPDNSHKKFAMEENPQQESEFGSLPTELQLKILGKLGGSDLAKMQRVSQRFTKITADVMDGKSRGAQEVREKARNASKDDIQPLVLEAASPQIFKAKLEKLIAKHRDIRVNITSSGWCRLNAQQVDIFNSVLKKQTHLRSLAIFEDKRPATVEPIITMLETVSSNSNLMELHVEIRSPFTPEQAESLARIRPLTSVHLRYSPEIGYRALAALLANPTISSMHFVIADIQESDTEWALVKQALADNESIEELSLQGMTDEALAAIAPALEKHRSLEKLVLRKCQPKSPGLEALGKALEHNTVLTNLDIDSSNMDNAGVAAFAPALEKNKALKRLSLCSNEIQAQGAQTLAESLKHNSTLIAVSLNLNKFGSHGINAVAEAALHMESLNILNMAYVSAWPAGHAHLPALKALRAAKPSMRIWVHQ